MAAKELVSSGVQDFIDKLKNDGVEAGRTAAEQIVSDARKEAEQIVSEARAEAESILETARGEIQRKEAASKEAIQLALRDARLKLKSEVQNNFASKVKRLVSLELQDQDLLRKLILIVAGQAAEEIKEHDVEILASEKVSELVVEISQKMLKEGFDIKPVPGSKAGIRVRSTNSHVEVDLSEEGISELLLKHLMPEFRSLQDSAGPAPAN